MKRSTRWDGRTRSSWSNYDRLYDTWPTRTEDTREGVLMTADLFDAKGDHAKAEQVRKGAKAFEGRPPWLSL